MQKRPFNPQRAPFQPPRPRAARAWLPAVLGLHVLALLALSNLGAWRDRGRPPAERPPLQVWLLDAFRPPPAEAPAPRQDPAAALPRPEPRRPPVLAGETQAITLPPVTPSAATPPPAAPVAAGPAPEAAPPAPAAPPPLNLALPRGASAPWRQRSLAADDPRSNTRRPVNMAALVARALGDDSSEPITEQRLEDGSVKFRRGNRCVIVHPSQTQALNPFNSSFSAKPGVVDSC